MSPGRAGRSAHATGRRGPDPHSATARAFIHSSAVAGVVHRRGGPHRTPAAVRGDASAMHLSRLLLIGPVALLLVAAAAPSPAPHRAAPVEVADGYVPPAEGPVLRLFDPPAVRWGRGHRGVDLAAPDGTVRSPGAGVVSFSGRVVDRGVVTVLHDDGLRSSLEPVDDAPPTGTPVAAGDPLGQVGAGAHCPARPCVHWGVRHDDTYVDPLDLLGETRVVLLP